MATKIDPAGLLKAENMIALAEHHAPHDHGMEVKRRSRDQRRNQPYARRALCRCLRPCA